MAEITPKYRRASATGDTVTLENNRIKMVFFKRICGWGFGEVYTPEGKLMAVLDHLGELMVRDQEIPMRLEAQSYDCRREGDTQVLSFPVTTTMAQQKLVGTSFESWVHFPFIEDVLAGTVTFSLKDGENVVRMHYAFQSKANLYVRYLRGPWLLAGEASFGTQKDDAMLPAWTGCWATNGPAAPTSSRTPGPTAPSPISTRSSAPADDPEPSGRRNRPFLGL